MINDDLLTRLDDYAANGGTDACEDDFAEAAALIRTLQAERDRPVEQKVMVKPLEWHKKEGKLHWWAAPDLFSATGNTTGYIIKVYAGSPTFHLHGPGHMGPGNNFPTLEAAMGAAQTDFEARVRSALLHADVPCAVCGGAVNTCEGTDDGCETDDGWVCSRACYDVLVPVPVFRGEQHVPSP